ncbi:MAG TPA: Rieske 2Fe-2S domain-containing protein, partial [Acidimicrobiales bacterium]|nr:Rieske 2Fe-2S domain-containing protein [Acidimicrobiales bacterium]
MRGGAAYVEVCRVGELAPGEMRAVQVGGERVVVANVGGEFFAVGAVCTHEHAYLDEGMVLDDQIYCP